MTIFDLLPPTPYEVARNYAIVMPVALSNRLKSFQESATYQGCIASPILLSDGRAAICADILTETAPGGLLYAMWEKADHAILGSGVEVVPWSDAVLLMPEPKEMM